MTRARITRVAAFSIAFGAQVAVSEAQTAGTPEDLLQKIDQVRGPADTFAFDLKLTVYQGQQVSSVREFTVRVKDSSKSLVIFTAPPKDRGRVLLMRGENLWIYIPTSRGALRISPQQRLLGPVAFGDVARVVYNLDYRVDRLAAETLDSQPTLRLDLRSKSKGAAHDRITLWVERDTLKPVKAEFLALSGKVLKVGRYRGYRSVLGRDRPMVFEIENLLKEGERAVLEYREIRKEDTPEAFFQVSYLEHVR